MDKSQTIAVEVVYAAPDKQKLLRLSVPRGTTMRQAAERSGIAGMFPELDLASAPMGIYGKLVAKPDERELAEGERVEIYRGLIADPKEARKQRAARAAAAKEKAGE